MRGYLEVSEESIPAISFQNFKFFLKKLEILLNNSRGNLEKAFYTQTQLKIEIFKKIIKIEPHKFLEEYPDLVHKTTSSKLTAYYYDGLETLCKMKREIVFALSPTLLGETKQDESKIRRKLR